MFTTDIGGTDLCRIMHDGDFVSGLCSGGTLRRCCVPDTVQGDCYWNKFIDYILTNRYGDRYG